MARPTKQGLDYFPLDVGFFEDIKVRRLKKDCGNQAISILIAIFCNVYRDEGYYVEINSDLTFLIAEQFGVSEDAVEKIVEKAIQVGIFDSGMFNNYKILTSRGIQERYFTAASRKSEVLVHRDFLLSGVNVCNNSVYVDRNPVSVCNNPQRKVKEIKEKESIEEDKGLTPSSGNDTLTYEEIISYLNDKAGTGYKANSQATKRKINARLNEGFKLDDFKTVIDNKCSEWLGDSKMSKYLRPETLFGTKFESYLQQGPTKKESPARPKRNIVGYMHRNEDKKDNSDWVKQQLARSRKQSLRGDGT